MSNLFRVDIRSSPIVEPATLGWRLRVMLDHYNRVVGANSWCDALIAQGIFCAIHNPHRWQQGGQFPPQYRTTFIFADIRVARLFALNFREDHD